jgi:TP901 family phage tail tape measure protein
MPSVPQIGAQAVILGMAAFNANARSVESQLGMLSAATYRLERASRGSFGGVAGAFTDMVSAINKRTQAATAAVQAQATASRVAAMKIAAAQESVAAANAASVAQQIAAIRASDAAEAAHASTVAKARAAMAAAQQKYDQVRVASALAERKSYGTNMAASNAEAAVVVANNRLKAASHREAAAAKQVADNAKFLPATDPAQHQAKAELEAAKAAVKAAQMQVAAATERSRLLQAAARTDAAAVVAANQRQVAAEQMLVAANENASARIVAADARRVAARKASTSAITAANAKEAAAGAAAGMAITAAENEKASAIDAAMQQVLSANSAAKASVLGLVQAVVTAAAIIATAIAAIGAAAVVMGQRYERALNFVGAISESSAAKVRELDEAQLSLSRRSTLTAMQLNEISGELLKAGQSMEEVLGGTLKATNDLVVASNGELQAANAAVMMQVMMAGFFADYQNKQQAATEAANAATVAVQRSTLSFGEFADAVRQGGGAASNFGLTAQQFSAAIGIMGKTINSGSEAGTGLRMMLLRMQNPTKEATELLNQYGVSLYDANGKAREFHDILADLENTFGEAAIKNKQLTEQERDHALGVIFSGRAVKSIIALLKGGTKGYLEMLDAMQKLSAEDLANQMLLPTAAQLDIVRNNVNALGLALNKGLDPYINKVVNSTLQWLQSLDLKQIIAFGDAVGSGLYNAFANFGNIMDHTVVPVMTMWVQWQNIGVIAVKGLIDVVWELSAAFIAAMGKMLAGIMAALKRAWDMFTAFGDFLLDVLAAMAAGLRRFIESAMTSFVTAIGNLMNTAAQIWVNTLPVAVQSVVSYVGNAISGLINSMSTVPAAANQMSMGWGNAWSNLAGFTGRILQWVLSKINGFIDGLSNLPIIGELVGGARAALGGFLGEVPRIAGIATNALGAMGKAASDAVANLNSLQIPKFHDFAGDVKKAWDAAAEGREKLAKSGRSFLPTNDPSESGAYPTDPDKGGTDPATKALQTAVKRAEEIIEDFNDDIAKEVARTSNDISELYRGAFEDLVKSALESQAEVADAIKDFDDEISGMEREKAIQRDADMRRALLEQSIEEENAARERGVAQSELMLEREREDLQRSLDFQREMREKYIDDVLDAEARARAETRDLEDQSFDDSQEKRENDRDRDLDLLKAKLDAEQAIRDAALEARLDAEERTIKASQDLREKALRAVLDSEKRAREQQQDLAKLNSATARDKAQAQKEYDEEIAKGVKQSIAQTRLNEKLKKIDEDYAEDRAKLGEDHAEENADAAFEAGQQSRLDKLREQFETEDLAFEKYAQGEKLKLEQQHQTEVTALEVEAERQRLELANKLREEARARDKRRTEEDRLFQEQQEATKRAQIAKLDAEDLARKRQEEDKELERQQRQEAVADMNRRMQEERRRMLELTLEKEDHQRKLDNMALERDERIRLANQALTEEQDATRTKLAQDIVDLRENLDERIGTLRSSYIDKLDDIAREGGAAILPEVNRITDTITDNLHMMRDAAQELVYKLAEAFDAQEKLSAEQSRQDDSGMTNPRDWFADYNFARGMGQSEDEARAYADGLKNHQYGGIVPGPFGAPVPIMAHGGERFEGVGAYNTALTAVRAAESMRGDSGVGAGNQYQYNYNVNAHYGRVQPEGSVRRDMSALVALTRR